MKNNNNNKPLFLLFSIISSLSFRYKRRLLLLLFLMIMGALSEFITIGLLFPFLKIISNFNINSESSSIKFLGFNSSFINGLHPNQIGLLLLIFVVLAALIKLYIYWKSGRISASIGTRLATDAFNGLLQKKYEDYLLLDSSKLISTVTNQVTKTAATIDSSLKSVSSIFVLFFVSFSLIYLNPLLTISIALFLTLMYLIIIKFTKNKLTRISYIITNQQKNSLKYVKESLSGFRDMKVHQSEDFFSENFKASDKILRINYAYSNFLSSFPKYTIEVIIISLIIMGAIFVPVKNNETFIATLGVFAFASQKLLPSIQQIYTGWARLKHTQSDLENVCSLSFKNRNPKLKNSLTKKISLDINDKFEFSEFTLNKVSYRYPNTEKNVLNKVDLKIKKGDKIGFQGISGCGKTTLVDLIVGLLEPNEGDIMIDGKSILGKEKIFKRKSWLTSISYVPQNIFISDQPICQNVAFGVADKFIDINRVKKCLEMSQLSYFANDSLPVFMEKNIGDSGKRISGGQRQRIAIARALYRNSSLLVLDESTSALDSDTEKDIIELIANLSQNITIVMIAHRLSTLKICNKVYRLSDGILTLVN